MLIHIFFFQFLVLSNQSEQDQEPISALALICLCPLFPTSWFLLNNPKQDKESLSAPCPYCPCQARGLFPVNWHNADTGLLHLILVL